MSITASTKLLGLIGWPVTHSLSPAMHNAAATALNLDLAYLPLAVHPQHLQAALQGLVALNFLGANVTVPHKQAVIPYLQTLDPAAQALGAVNTLTIPDSQSLIPNLPVSNPQSPNPQSPISSLPVSNPHPLLPLAGHNTDHAGFLADLQAHDILVEGRRCFVLGAGGSARAVVYALANNGAESVTVFARRPAQAVALVAALQTHVDASTIHAASWQDLHEGHMGQAPLIVNTTPVGMYPHHDHSPWPHDLPFPPGAEVYDLVYNPSETLFMQQARAAGCRALNGLGMLLHQGALAFELWTGQKPPLDVMAAALRRQGVE